LVQGKGRRGVRACRYQPPATGSPASEHPIITKDRRRDKQANRLTPLIPGRRGGIAIASFLTTTSLDICILQAARNDQAYCVLARHRGAQFFSAALGRVTKGGEHYWQRKS
jgi:hypothetical protein